LYYPEIPCSVENVSKGDQGHTYAEVAGSSVAMCM